MDLNACIEREEPRLSDGRDLRRILHLEKSERRSLTVAVGKKIDGLRLQIFQNGLDGRAEFSGLAAAFPDSTGIFTLSKNRMVYLLMIWFLGFA
jgi:hypothetical protein